MDFYGLLGERLEHSLSPRINKIILEKNNTEGAYKLFEIPNDKLGDFVNAIKLLKIKGFNVTIPYKESIIKYLDNISDEAARIGAVNTVMLKDNKLYGYNTDYFGIHIMLKSKNISIKNKTAVVLGAGGACKAVITYLLDNDVEKIYIVSRNPKNINLNKDNKKISIINYNDLINIKGYLIINTTPVGMFPKIYDSAVNKEVIKFIDRIVEECGKEKHEYEHVDTPEDLWNDMVDFITPEAMEEAVFTDVKQVREENIRQIKEKLEERYAEEHEDWLPLIDDAVYKFQKKTVRKMILKDHKRPDGRAINEIRPLAAEIDLLPRVHGSGMFTRGQTQIMTITTLAPLSEAQKIDGLDANITSKRYMHHYNFPSYSVGETKPSRGPGRREIGHGALAERALVPVLPSEDEFPYAIRTVSETLESNGSTSQASICASTLSLMAAGVPIKKPVAGISTGLVTGDSDDDYIVLTDIQGLEDFFGDMDFKVAGTHDGITAIQMDIKIHGLTPDIIREAISRTKEAREHILTDVMEPVLSTPRDHVGEYAPKIMQMHVDPDKISEIIGKQGKTINAIIDETGVKIDINDEGRVDICGVDQAMIDRAMEIIRLIVEPVEAGKIYEGEVVRIMNFGAFVQLAPNKDGLIHISKLSKERVEKVEDVVNIGDKVKVKVLEIDKMGRINLALREIIK